jgi:hypothetical protein
VDFLLSERRDVATAKRFFCKTVRRHGRPRVITLDAYAALHRAIRELKSEGSMSRRVRIRSTKSEQHLGARSSPDQTADWVDAGVQAIRHGDSHDHRNRIGGEDQESSVQDRKASGPIGHSANNLGGCSGSLKPSKRLSTCEVF